MVKLKTNDGLISTPIGVGDTSQVLPEFGRWRDVQAIFALKRGLVYRLIKDGSIRSITLREPGRKFGCRLIYLPSVRAYLNGLLEAQSPASITNPISQGNTAQTPGYQPKN